VSGESIVGQNRTGAVLYAKDLSSVQAFYETVAGLAVEHVERGHVILGTASFQLVVLRIPERVASSIQIENPPRRRTETPIKLVFFVPSIAEARAAAAMHGGEVNPAEREWKFQGCRVCDGHDPEGNVVQFREAPTPRSTPALPV
jgi:predicted enzyme related to lactoylglutathione lyase